jgi:hypothetical protein
MRTYEYIMLFALGNCDEISNICLKRNHYNRRKGRGVTVHTTKTCEGVEVQIWLLLIAVRDGGEWPGSCASQFTPEEREAGTHCMGGCVGPRTGLDAEEKKTEFGGVYMN